MLATRTRLAVARKPNTRERAVSPSSTRNVPLSTRVNHSSSSPAGFTTMPAGQFFAAWNPTDSRMRAHEPDGEENTW